MPGVALVLSVVRQRQSMAGFFNEEPDHAHPVLDAPISPLRQRLVDGMNVRGFTEDTRRDYIRRVKRFAAFIGRSPDTATAEDPRADVAQIGANL